MLTHRCILFNMNVFIFVLFFCCWFHVYYLLMLFFLSMHHFSIFPFCKFTCHLYITSTSNKSFCDIINLCCGNSSQQCFQYFTCAISSGGGNWVLRWSTKSWVRSPWFSLQNLVFVNVVHWFIQPALHSNSNCPCLLLDKLNFDKLTIKFYQADKKHFVK